MVGSRNESVLGHIYMAYFGTQDRNVANSLLEYGLGSITIKLMEKICWDENEWEDRKREKWKEEQSLGNEA